MTATSASAAHPRVVFVHLPKTAGLSLYKALVQWARPKRSLRYALGGAEETAIFRQLPQERLDELWLLSGHLPWTVFRERCDTSWLPITVVRDPVERTLSKYSYIRGWEGHPSHQLVKDMSVRQFVEWQVRELGRNSQCHALSGTGDAQETRRVLDERGFMASSVGQLDRLVEALSKRLSFPLELTRENTTPQRMRADDVDSATLELIRSEYDQDVLLVEALGAKPLLTGRPSLSARARKLLGHLRPADQFAS